MALLEVFKDLILFSGALFGTQGALFNLFGCAIAAVLSAIKLVGSKGLVDEGILSRRGELPS